MVKTNFQIIANLLREVKMNEVIYYFTNDYKKRLKSEQKFKEKCQKMNFPTLDDFEPHFVISRFFIISRACIQNDSLDENFNKQRLRRNNEDQNSGQNSL